MKEVLNHLLSHKSLSRETARQVLIDISQGKVNVSQMACFMTVYMMRTITVEELEGFRDAMLDLCIDVDLSEYEPIDLCGTGGDGKDTFNISTTASFVVAGAGVKVAKHGNYGVSSNCGSSNVLEYLGYKFTSDKAVLKNQIEKAGICVMHAPLFHPAMKNVAPVRRDLGVRTFFNMLGPMINPAFPNNQMIGVFSLELARLYNYLYQKSGKHFVILHSLDVYDEISLTGLFKVIGNSYEHLMCPEDLGFKTCKPEDLKGGSDVAGSGKILMNILENKGTEIQNNAVLANAAMAIHCARPKLSIADSIEAAKESLKSGKALNSFKIMMENNA